MVTSGRVHSPSVRTQASVSDASDSSESPSSSKTTALTTTATTTRAVSKRGAKRRRKAKPLSEDEKVPKNPKLESVVVESALQHVLDKHVPDDEQQEAVKVAFNQAIRPYAGVTVITTRDAWGVQNSISNRVFAWKPTVPRTSAVLLTELLRHGVDSDANPHVFRGVGKYVGNIKLLFSNATQTVHDKYGEMLIETDELSKSKKQTQKQVLMCGALAIGNFVVAHARELALADGVLPCIYGVSTNTHFNAVEGSAACRGAGIVLNDASAGHVEAALRECVVRTRRALSKADVAALLPRVAVATPCSSTAIVPA